MFSIVMAQGLCIYVKASLIDMKQKKLFRRLLGCLLLTTGTGHLSFAREAFQAQVPNWVPVSKHLTVILSGIVEIALGLGLVAMVKYKVGLGRLAALFFALVFPGNIAQYLNRRDAFGLNSDTARLIRLFFQPVFIAWALWSTASKKTDGLKKHIMF